MRTILITLLLLVSVSLWASESPAPRDFAYGATISVSGAGAVYKATLPELIYGRVTRADLADLRVFNRNGQIVPHSLRRPVSSLKQQQPAVAVPHFPLYRSAAEVKGGNYPLSVKISTDAKGSVVDVKSAVVDNTEQQLYGYLLDISQLKQIPNKISFAWVEPADNFIASVKVEYSNNLNKWYNLVRKSTVTRMQYGDYQLDNHSINLPRRKAKYLRVTWLANKPVQQVSKITLDFADALQQQPWQWKYVTGNAHQSEAAVYEFDSKAFLPVERLKLQLPERNTLVHVRLLSRADTEQPWRYRYAGNVYQLIIDGNELNSRDIQLPIVSDRYWRLEVEASNGGLGSGLPLL